MIYKKDFTTTYTINGHEYTVTALALFNSNTIALYESDSFPTTANVKIIDQ